MKTRLFHFDLPPDRIAQFPEDKRGTSKLLVFDRKSRDIWYDSVDSLVTYLDDSSCLVFNDTKVRKARFHVPKVSTGGTVEFLLVRRCQDDTWEAVCSKSKKQNPGNTYEFPEGVIAEITASNGTSKKITFTPPVSESYIKTHGHVPLPPYIKRSDTPFDMTRYQTVFAKHTGSVAAPTASLHFTESLMKEIEQNGHHIHFVTLHVGLGTFSPVRSEQIEDHPMHFEYYSISDDTAKAVTQARHKGRNVTAFGTTSTRTLESAWKDNALVSGEGKTNLFIYPGYQFRVVDTLFTNFHTPQSTLLMLVCAFAGREKVLELYKNAFERDFRFYSYGDAMMIR